MTTFSDSVNEEYPELANQLVEEYGDVQTVIKVPHHVPGYILPIVLTILLAVFYVAVMHVKCKAEQVPVEKHLAEIEQKLADVQTGQDKHTLAIHLLAILHNENLSVIKAATGIQNLIFINEDWTIDQLPTHLKMSKDDREHIAENFLSKRRN